MGPPGPNGDGSSLPAPATSVRRILTLGGHDFTSRPPDRAVCELPLRLAGERVVEMRLATAYLGDAPPVTRLPGATSSSLSTASAA